MRHSVTIFLFFLLAFLPAIGILAPGKDKGWWRTGRLSSFTLESWDSSSTSPVTCNAVGSLATCSGSNTVNWGHVTYHVTIVEGRDALYAYRTLSWRWQRSPRLTENASVKFAVDRNQLTLIDDDGRAFKMEIGKKRLNTPGEQLEECRNSVIDLHQQFPTPDALGDGLKQLSGPDLYNTFISNLQCSNVSMELQDFGLVTQFEAIRLAMLAARTDQGQVTDAPASQVEDQVCQQTISSVEASPMTPLTTGQLSEKARILYRCAMADYQKGGDKWFLRTSLARQKILTEIVARQANAGVGEHYAGAQQEKHAAASSPPVEPSASVLPNEPSHSMPSSTAAASDSAEHRKPRIVCVGWGGRDCLGHVDTGRSRDIR